MKRFLILLLMLGILGCTKKTTRVIYINQPDTTKQCDDNGNCHHDKDSTETGRD